MTLLSSVFLLDIECWDETFYLYLQLSKDAIPLSLVPIVSAGMSAPILTLFPVPNRRSFSSQANFAVSL